MTIQYNLVKPSTGPNRVCIYNSQTREARFVAVTLKRNREGWLAWFVDLLFELIYRRKRWAPIKLQDDYLLNISSALKRLQFDSEKLGKQINNIGTRSILTTQMQQVKTKVEHLFEVRKTHLTSAQRNHIKSTFKDKHVVCLTRTQTGSAANRIHKIIVLDQQLFATGGFKEIFSTRNPLRVLARSKKFKDNPKKTAQSKRYILSENKLSKTFKKADYIVEPAEYVIHFLDNTIGLYMKRYNGTPNDKTTHKNKICLQVAIALQAMHNKGLIHCDIKRPNIFLENTGARLADLGLARTPEPGRRSGTPRHYSPELAKSKAKNTKVSDMWALGLTFYVIFFDKRPPFIPTTKQRKEFFSQLAMLKQPTIDKGLNSPVTGKNPLPKPIQLIIHGLLQVTPKDRWKISDVIAKLRGKPPRS